MIVQTLLGLSDKYLIGAKPTVYQFLIILLWTTAIFFSVRHV